MEQANTPENSSHVATNPRVLEPQPPRKRRITPRRIARIALEATMILMILALAYVILLPVIKGPSASVQRRPVQQGSANR